jgi:ribose 5-phosphate isomerase B
VSSEKDRDASPITEDEIRRLVSVVVDEAIAVKGSDRPKDAATVAVGADHGGFALKEIVVEHLRGQGLSVHDCGCTSTDAVDYPDFAHAVANLVGTGVCRWGIIVDGAGIGSCIAANKVPGVRAALCYDLSSARNSREHNHANVLTLGAGLIGAGLAREIVDEWLATPWGPDRHARRVAKITDIEQRYLRSGAEP